MNWRTDPKLDADTKTRIDVTRIAANLHDEPRDLELHEKLFLSAVKSIRDRFNHHRGTAAKQYGWKSEGHEAVCNLSDRQEAHEYRQALQSYEMECTRLSDDYDDSEVFAEAAE